MQTVKSFRNIGNILEYTSAFENITKNSTKEMIAAGKMNRIGLLLDFPHKRRELCLTTEVHATRMLTMSGTQLSSAKHSTDYYN